MKLEKENILNYNNWLKSISDEITNDSLWKMEAYRLGLFVADIGWFDVTILVKDKRTIRLSDQLYRALGSISANLCEVYSRGTGKDRARFYEYALGSARESRDWCYKSRHILGEVVTKNRICLITQIIRLLLKMVHQQRKYKVHEKELEHKRSENKCLVNVPMP